LFVIAWVEQRSTDYSDWSARDGPAEINGTPGVGDLAIPGAPPTHAHTGCRLPSSVIPRICHSAIPPPRIRQFTPAMNPAAWF